MTTTADDPPRGLAHSLNFAGNNPPDGVISALALEPFISGAQPWQHGAELNQVRGEAPLLPPGTRPVRSYTEDGLRSHLATGPGWTLMARRTRNRAAVVLVSAVTDELAHTVLAAATAGATDEPGPADAAVTVGFWHDTRTHERGARNARTVDVLPWADIRANYSSDVAAALDRVMVTRPGDVSGRLLLLHGPAGTGKTTALRAVAHAWREWCQVECILDPETLFTKPGYLTSVALGEQRRDEVAGWRLLLVEDCDELIRAEAGAVAGQALSRLLNLTDGLLGQGLDVLVCLTTNEPVARLHPAVVRPGRCLAEIEVGPLAHAEAVRWLGRADGVDSGGATLAELYRLRGALRKVEHAAAPAAVGNYL